ncbi:hypothetical protein BMR08_15960 [Methylococcaceae bacterium CS2]|nr:hypothetical protein BMR08_15960 [Methylococcaceae bacterium CS2]
MQLNKVYSLVIGLFLSSVLTSCAEVNGALQYVHIGTVNETQIQAYVYECPDNYRFTVGVKDNVARLYFPEQTIKLAHAFSLTGAKFSNRDATLWLKDTKAYLEINSIMHEGCINNSDKAIWVRAKLNGVDFRALGNQSSWILEIVQGDNIIFADYLLQIKQFLFSNPDINTGVSTGKTIYTASNDEHSIVITIIGTPCQNIISDEIFDFSVTVKLDNELFHGCGRSLI